MSRQRCNQATPCNRDADLAEPRACCSGWLFCDDPRAVRARRLIVAILTGHA